MRLSQKDRRRLPIIEEELYFSPGIPWPDNFPRIRKSISFALEYCRIAIVGGPS